MPILVLLLFPFLILVLGALLLCLPEPSVPSQQAMVLILRLVGMLLLFQGMRMVQNLPRLLRIWRNPVPARTSKPSANPLQGAACMQPILDAATQYFRMVYTRDTTLPVSGAINIFSAWAFVLLVSGYGFAAFYGSIRDVAIFHDLLSNIWFLPMLAISALLLSMERQSARWMQQAYGTTSLTKTEALEQASRLAGLSPSAFYRFVQERCSADFDRPWKAAFGIPNVLSVYWLFLLEPLVRYGMPWAGPGTAPWHQGLALALVALLGSGLFLAIRHLLYRQYEPSDYPYPCSYFPLRRMCADIRDSYDL